MDFIFKTEEYEAFIETAKNKNTDKLKNSIYL